MRFRAWSCPACVSTAGPKARQSRKNAGKSRQEQALKGYSTQEIVELLEIPEATIRGYARSGIVSPGRGPKNTYEFQFQDLVMLRTAKALQEAGIRQGKILRVLQVLKDSLQDDRPLTSLRIEGSGSEVVIHDRDGIVNPESGQVHMDFSHPNEQGSVESLPWRTGEDVQTMSAEDWFDLAIDLETSSPKDAPAAYRRVLDIDSRHAEAHINLGRLLQESGSLRDAGRHYEEALRIEPDNMLAAFNLGTLHEETGRLREAIDAYKMASGLADAHYNLSRLYEQLGEIKNALMHLKVYHLMVDPPGNQD